MSQAVADRLAAADIPVIAINSTHRLVPFAWMVYAADAEWWTHPTNAEALKFSGHKVAISTPETIRLQRYGVQLLRRENQGFSDDPACVTALGNSGAQAIQIAVKTGAARVLLCGFDFRVTTEACHWHGPHPTGLRVTDPDLYAGWAQRLAGIAPELLARSEVLNCTPSSALKCFPAMALEDALCAVV